MRAAVYQGAWQVEQLNLPRPEPGSGEVVLKVEAAGVCGSDRFILTGHHPRVKAPLVLSHEFVGTVEETAPDAAGGPAPGDRVAVFPLLFCGACRPCRMGQVQACATLGLYGIDRPGGTAEYVKVQASSCVALPRDLDFDRACITEPLAVAVHAVNLSGLNMGDMVVVQGDGPIGLLTALTARRAGAGQVIVTGKRPYRMDIARGYGFPTYDVREADPREPVARHTGGEMADVVFECTGREDAIAVMTDLVAVRGTVMTVGVAHDPYPVNCLTIMFKELTIRGPRCYSRRDFETAAALIAAGEIDVGPLISHRDSLDETTETFRRFRDEKEFMKMLIVP